MSTQTTLLPETCKSCGADIVWAIGDQSGRRLALDVAPAPVAERRVVFNPVTGVCHVLTTADLPLVAAWIARGASVHRAHFGTCPKSGRWNTTTGEPQ